MMEDKLKRHLYTAIVLFVVNSLIMVLVLLLKQDYSIRGFSDASFISGFTTLLMYSLRVLGAKGAYDLIGYTAIRFRDTFRKDYEKTYESAHEYTEHKREERLKNKQSFLFHFIIPSLFIFTAIILAIIAMQ